MRLADITPETDFTHLIPCAGTLPEWSAAANRLFASGCEGQGFALLASFAAPLMSLLRTEDGGAVVSLYGAKKSGKSIAHTAAASVWGGEEADLSLSPYSGVLRYTKLSYLVNSPVFDDTLAARDPEVVRMFLGNFVRRMKGLEWQTLLISFSPLPLGGVPGVELPLGVPPPLQVAHAKGRDPLAYDLHANRGCAGLDYMKYLAHPTTQRWARKTMAMQIAQMREDGAGDDKIYAMRAIAAVHVAGLMVTMLGILEFDIDRITRWAREKALATKEVAS